MTEKEHPLPTQPDHIQNSGDTPEDEISLIDAFEVLVRKKIPMLTVTLIFTLLAIFYAQSITPVYRTTIGFLPSDETDFASYIPDYLAEFLPGFTKHNLNGVVVKKNELLFEKFLSVIQSYRLQEKVFIENNFIKRFTNDNLDSSEIKNIVLEMSNSIRVSPNGKNAKASHVEAVYLEMVGAKPEIMSDFLNALAEAAKIEVANSTKESIRRQVKNQLSNYSAKLESLRTTAELERAQKIKHLSENLEIAKNLGIVKNNLDHFKTNSFIFIEDQQTPLWYLYGQHALEQELEMLKRQPLSDLYIRDVAKLNLEISKSSRFDLSKINLEPVIIIQPSIPPARPFEPDKRKIIAAGIALGLLIGVIAVFLSNVMDQLRERKKLSTSTTERSTY